MIVVTGEKIYYGSFFLFLLNCFLVFASVVVFNAGQVDLRVFCLVVLLFWAFEKKNEGIETCDSLLVTPSFALYELFFLFCYYYYYY